MRRVAARARQRTGERACRAVRWVVVSADFDGAVWRWAVAADRSWIARLTTHFLAWVKGVDVTVNLTGAAATGWLDDGRAKRSAADHGGGGQGTAHRSEGAPATQPNVQAQGRCAALLRSIPWSAVLGQATYREPLELAGATQV